MFVRSTRSSAITSGSHGLSSSAAGRWVLSKPTSGGEISQWWSVHAARRHRTHPRAHRLFIDIHTKLITDDPAYADGFYDTRSCAPRTQAACGGDCANGATASVFRDQSWRELGFQSRQDFQRALLRRTFCRWTRTTCCCKRRSGVQLMSAEPGGTERALASISAKLMWSRFRGICFSRRRTSARTFRTSVRAAFGRSVLDGATSPCSACVSRTSQRSTSCTKRYSATKPHRTEAVEHGGRLVNAGWAAAVEPVVLRRP